MISPNKHHRPKKSPPSSPGLFELDITGYGANGEGVGRLPDGMACFVAGALAGERCRVALDHVGRSAAWGHVEEILIPSAGRVEPDCPYYVNCGGCMTRHMSYPCELEFKRQKVEDCLRRIGGVDLPVSVIHGAKNTERYRNKVQFPISAGAIGFYRGGSHAVTDVEDCLLQPLACARARQAVLDFMSTHRVPAYEEKTGRGLLRHLYLRTNREGQVLVCLLANGDSLPHETELVQGLQRAVPGLQGVVLGVNRRRDNVILGERYRTLWGQDFLMDTLGGFSFRLSVPSFYQVNADQAEVLYGRALELAALTGKETVLDLYCGIGTITLCLARQARRVLGAEVVPQAIEDARENARRNGVENAEFFCGDAAQVAEKLAAEGLRPQVVTVDPPRKGLAESVVGSIARMGPERVVYVSCDPATLARDVARFARAGYRAARAEAVDLFPRTSHVESVVSLFRTSPSDHYQGQTGPL